MAGVLCFEMMTIWIKWTLVKKMASVLCFELMRFWTKWTRVKNNGGRFLLPFAYFELILFLDFVSYIYIYYIYIYIYIEMSARPAGTQHIVGQYTRRGERFGVSKWTFEQTDACRTKRFVVQTDEHLNKWTLVEIWRACCLSKRWECEQMNAGKTCGSCLSKWWTFEQIDVGKKWRARCPSKWWECEQMNTGKMAGFLSFEMMEICTNGHWQNLAGAFK